MYSKDRFRCTISSSYYKKLSTKYKLKEPRRIFVKEEDLQLIDKNGNIVSFSKLDIENEFSFLIKVSNLIQI